MANEKRLIDANQLWKYAWNELQKANKRHEGEPDFQAWSSGVAEVIAALAKDMPTVDAVEVVHGRWISDGLGDGERICSVCRRYALYTHRDRYDQYLTDHCPSCGADMRGEK